MAEDFLGMSVRDFAAATADKTPTPGGGSVAGAVGMLAVALGEMSLNFTRGKKKFAEHEPFHAHLAGRMEKARALFADLVADDVAAYSYYQETSRLPDGPEKHAAQQTATAAAIAVPREATTLALAVLEDLAALSDKCNPYLITDLVAAGVLAVAVTQLSDLNVRVNVPSLDDKQAADDLRKASRDDIARAREWLVKIEQVGDAILGSSQ